MLPSWNQTSPLCSEGSKSAFIWWRTSIIAMTHRIILEPSTATVLPLNLLNVFSPNAHFSPIPLKRTGQCSQRGCVWRFSCRTTDTGGLEVSIEMFAMAQQRGRPCRVPTEYRSFDHTAAACHWQLRSTGATASPKQC